MTAEHQRLSEDNSRSRNWKRWGSYLAERQWATVREDYSVDGSCWDYFPHDHARSRAYRWGEDGLLGFTDRQCRICFGLALWNGQDPFLKERLFGLTGPQGNHGEDVKECYYYLRATPTHSYQKALYKYTQSRFPYEEIQKVNAERSRHESEYELDDTSAFTADDYFDITVEYAKASPEDILIRIGITNRSENAAQLHVLPQLWFRNTWSFGGKHIAGTKKPAVWRDGKDRLRLERETLGNYVLDHQPDIRRRGFLFTNNVTNHKRLFNAENQEEYVKDAFHDYVCGQHAFAVSNQLRGTKAAGHYIIGLEAGAETEICLRFTAEGELKEDPFADFAAVLAQRRQECDEFYAAILPQNLPADKHEICMQAHAGLIWSKQFYYYSVEDWVHGDARHPFPAEEVYRRRNQHWQHLFARDVLSMPDKWEYPWFAAWDLAFHMVPMAEVDASFSKQQLQLLLREWYLHPNGQIPAYEFSFSDVNPPVHAWSAWQVYLIDKKQRGGEGDRTFLAGVFHKLLMNFTWWVNRKDEHGEGIFAGGFLGLDNIGVFDRGAALPTGGQLEQADATAWMAFYSLCMLRMAIELSTKNGELQTPYEDMASKFFEHFLQIADAINTHGGSGLWNELDGFYYDQVRTDKETVILKTRSLVGLLPLIAVEILTDAEMAALPGFSQRFEWFRRHRPDLSKHLERGPDGSWLLSIMSKDRLVRVLRRLADEDEFLSPYGIRSLSRTHLLQPFTLCVNDQSYVVTYTPGESTTAMFGGNSNWRGPVWFPVNHLLVEALETYDLFYGQGFKIECPVGTAKCMTMGELAGEIRSRLISLFMPDSTGHRPCHGGREKYATDPHWKDLILFHEYFHGDHGKGLGASHQTGWTALVASMIQKSLTRII